MSRYLTKLYFCGYPYIIANSYPNKYIIRTFVTSLPSRDKDISKYVKKDSNQTIGQKAKEATKTTYYAAIVVFGIGALGAMLYSVFGELFASFSTQSVYSCAVKKVSSHTRVSDLLGDSIKSYGETSRRGRRQHISHFPYEVDGVKGMRIKFYVQGQRRSGTVHLDARATSSGWDFRYLFLQMDAYPHEVIVIEDNRGQDSGETSSQSIMPSSIFGSSDEA